MWTIFAGDPPDENLSSFALEQHNRWNPKDDYLESRRKEDILACQQIGARFRHLPFPDCIYRKSLDDSWLYDSESAIFGSLSSDDVSTIDTIKLFLETILKPSDHVVVPLAIGNHIDHQIIKKVAEGFSQSKFYYADIPYAFRQIEDYEEATKNLRSNLYDLSEEDVNSWLEAIRRYSSQVNTLFGDVERMRNFILKYYNSSSGYHLWSTDKIS